MSGTEPKSRADRVDPGGEGRLLMEGVKAISSKPFSWFARALGIDEGVLDDVKRTTKEARQLFGALDPVSETVARYGWILFENAPIDAYREAARLFESGDLDRGHDAIVEAWNGHDALSLRFSVQLVQNLYRLPGFEFAPDGPDIGHQRAALIAEAIDCHRAGYYGGAISIAFAQMDGISADMNAGIPFFSRDRGTGDPRAPVTDETTLAGHPEGLRALARMMTEQCRTTTVEGRLLRHGVLHGRELAYNTPRNSTQALAALLALIVWAEPIARKRLEGEASEYEAQHAGSRERDGRGRRLDRRGFQDAKNTLIRVESLQQRWHEQHGRFASSRTELDPSGLMFEEAELDIRSTNPTDSYWASIVTATGYVFGIAGEAGTPVYSEYAGDELPTGGLESGIDWRHTGSQDPHPDWE